MTQRYAHLAVNDLEGVLRAVHSSGSSACAGGRSR